LVTMIFTCWIFIGSLLLLVAAGILYIPLVCYIRGNLKEYCCHKVDKRIAELMKKKNKQRLAKAAALARKEAAGDYSHLQNKKGEFVAKPLPQPTLPKIALDDYEGSDTMSMRTRVEPDYGQGKWKNEYAYSQDTLPQAAPDYPPMPPYQAYGQNTYEAYPEAHNEQYPYGYDDRYGDSQVALTHAAAPISGHLAANAGSLPNPYSAQREHFSSTDVTTPHPSDGYGNYRPSSGGLPYDDYPQQTHYQQAPGAPQWGR